MAITRERFGVGPDGTVAFRYLLTGSGGFSVGLTDYGATVTSLSLPDRTGRIDNIALGFDDLKGYLDDDQNIGGTIGRFANRIAGARFVLQGRTHTLVRNDGPHHLHGGIGRFNKVMWSAEPVSRAGREGVRFSRLSQNNEEGYPGNLNVSVTYYLVGGKNELLIAYEAETDRPTPFNPTNHAYFNLAGAGRGTVLDHRLWLACSRYLPVDADNIPLGRILPVKGTPYDFTHPKSIGRDIAATKVGYDICFVLDDDSPPDRSGLRTVGRVEHPGSGRSLEIFTDRPGVQFYTGNFLSGISGAGGAVYGRWSGFCLETQNFPDAVNQPGFPDPILRPGEIFRSTTRYVFHSAGT